MALYTYANKMSNILLINFDSAYVYGRMFIFAQFRKIRLKQTRNYESLSTK